jgi:hypothetical protein
MKYFIIGVLLGVLSALAIEANAHEMTPTYPKLRPSFFDGMYVTEMEIFNKREDVRYYELGVFDNEWKSIPFVSAYTILKVNYLDHVRFSVFIRKEDVSRATYLCSRSKLRKDDSVRTAITSRICSKFK